jgi:hypothetical protein
MVALRNQFRGPFSAKGLVMVLPILEVPHCVRLGGTASRQILPHSV